MASEESEEDVVQRRTRRRAKTIEDSPDEEAGEKKEADQPPPSMLPKTRKRTMDKITKSPSNRDDQDSADKPAVKRRKVEDTPS